MVTYVKISELPPATEATGDSELEVNQAGITRKITVDQIADVIAEILPPPDMSDYATDAEVADAIAAIPDPAWTEITGKPATFPPTVPIAWDDISGEPDFNALYVNVAGDTMTGALSGTSATMSGNIISTGGNITASGGSVVVDRIGDAVSANLTVAADAAFTAGVTLNGGVNSRWILRKNATAESGSNAGSDFEISPRTDAGGALPTAVVITRSTGIAAFSAIPTHPTPTAGDNTTKSATTAFVTAALAGGVVQTVSYQTGAVATGTTIIPFDDTIPQITEGNEYMTLAITPRSATSKLIIEVVIVLGCSATTSYTSVALFQDATANALAAATSVMPGALQIVTIPLRHAMVSGTTSTTTFRVRAGSHAAGTTTFNGNNSTRVLGGVMASSIVIQEVAP